VLRGDCGTINNSQQMAMTTVLLFVYWYCAVVYTDMNHYACNDITSAETG
jgi:hypothetical protein